MTRILTADTFPAMAYVKLLFTQVVSAAEDSRTLFLESFLAV